MPITKSEKSSSASFLPGRNSQFIEGTRPLFSHPNIDDQLKFAQLLKILGTPTWQGGER
jgi:hypothetical protein